MPVLLLVVFINFVGIGALIPVLPYTVIETLGLSATVMTLLLASFAMAMFLSNPLLGRLSDKIGRRPVLIASLFINALAHLWFAFPMIFYRCLRRVFLPGWQLAIPG